MYAAPAWERMPGPAGNPSTGWVTTDETGDQFFSARKTGGEVVSRLVEVSPLSANEQASHRAKDGEISILDGTGTFTSTQAPWPRARQRATAACTHSASGSSCWLLGGNSEAIVAQSNSPSCHCDKFTEVLCGRLARAKHASTYFTCYAMVTNTVFCRTR